MLQRQLNAWAWLFLAPALALFALVVVYPFIYAIGLSLYEWNILGKPKFVGLRNYVRMFSDPLFQKSLKNTFAWTLGVVPVTMIVGLVLAVILNHKALRFKGLFRTIYFIPVMTNMVAAAFVWRWLFEPTFGVVNYFLRKLSIPGPGWLADPQWALPAMMVVGIWKQIGFSMVIFLAGLQAIPKEFEEAAAIDGASPWQTFKNVTMPLLNPTVVFVAVMLVINALRVFTIPYVMSAGGLTHQTPGGPLDSTRVFVLHIYDLAFRKLDIGYASANAMVLQALILIVTLIQLRILQRPFQY